MPRLPRGACQIAFSTKKRLYQASLLPRPSATPFLPQTPQVLFVKLYSVSHRLILADMRNLLVICILLVAAFAISLSAVLDPFLSFRRYAQELPVVYSHSHIQNSLTSIRDTGLASLCLSPLFSKVSSFCSWPVHADGSPDVYATVVDLALIRVRMGEQLVQHDLTDSFKAVLAIQRASDIALADDDLILLFENRNPALHGTGHVRLLVEVNRAARSLWAALHRITLHVELGLSRLSYIDKTMFATMKRFDRSVDGHQIVPVEPPLLNHLVNISSSAATDSIHHVLAEIATAEAAFTVLLDALQRFTKDNRAQRQCTLPAVKNVCGDITVLWSSERLLQTVRKELAKVTQVLDDASRGLSTAGTGPNVAQIAGKGASPGINPRILEENTRKLLRSSWFVRQARKVAEAVLEAAKS